MTYLATLPGFVVMVAADEVELTHMVATAAQIDSKIAALQGDIVTSESKIATLREQFDAAGKQVQITIHDNGPGIPPDIMKTLFEPFITRQKSGGTGLGLAIVRQYITAHGGDIRVENNKGALFTISLPLQQ